MTPPGRPKKTIETRQITCENPACGKLKMVKKKIGRGFPSYCSSACARQGTSNTGSLFRLGSKYGSDRRTY